MFAGHGVGIKTQVHHWAALQAEGGRMTRSRDQGLALPTAQEHFDAHLPSFAAIQDNLLLVNTVELILIFRWGHQIPQLPVVY
jgi:hypothetical protein